MEFTEDQKRIIDSRDKNVLVSAAAGSGKTTVLVARVLKLIEEGANIDEFLIVTFTRAAASSMKKKLYEELLKRAENGDRHFADQLERLDFSSICTMHSFCMDVLREQYEKADIDPCFRVMDDAELMMLLSETIDEVLEEAYANRDEGMNRLIALRTVKEVRDLTENLYTYLCTRPDSKQWFEHAISLMQGDLKVYTDIIAREISQSILSAIKIFEKAKNDSMEYGGPYTYAVTLEQDIELLKTLCGHDYAYYHAASGLTFAQIADKPKDSDANKAKAVRQLRDNGKKEVLTALALASLPLETAMEDLRFDVPVIGKLYEMAEKVRSILREKKKERSVLTFDDMEHYALEVLSDPEAAGRRYKYVFIDEYQDTSDTQNALISAVAGDNNLFMVGDIKQSIYRFRNAVPELFQEKYETYRRGEDPLSECIVLRENFRSRKSILDFVNRVFERVMVGGSSDIEYDDDARLNPGGTFKGPDAPVELMIVDQKGRSEETDGGDAVQSDGEAPENDQKEAIAVAQRIRELHEEGIEYWEICVLSRSKTHMASMAEVFASESIPCYAEGVEGYFDTAEVLVLRAALKLLADRRNEIALLAVLHSPMFGVTEPELAQMKLGMPRETPLWEAADMESENNPKIARFFELYAVWRECLHGFGLCELIRKILSDTGFYAFAGALPGGEQRQANLDLFCANALVYEQNFGCSLTGLLDFLEKKQAKDEAGGAGVLGENDNVVRLMTDHKSKGLEFKVVFAVNLGKSFSQKRPDPVALFKDKELGIGMPHLDLTLKSQRESLAQRAIKQKNESKELAEELRVLYVTMTRAIDRLILVGSVSNLQSSLDKWKLLAQEPLGYHSALDIVASAAMACPGSEIMEYGKTDENLPRVETTIVPGGDMTADDDSVKTDISSKVNGMLESDLMDEDLYETILWKYPEKEKPYAPVKLAVTGLNREFTGGDRLPEVMTAPDFISGRDRNESTDRGTAIHMALRKLDYTPFETNRDRAFVLDEVTRQIDSLLARDILSEEEHAMVEPSLIADFVLSDIGARFMKAETKKREMSFSLRMPVRRVIPDYPEEGDIFVQGCIDMCFIENGKWVLADYKTNRTHNIDELIDHYKYQLDIYAEALETLTGIPVAESYLCLLTLHKQIRVQNGRWEKQ